MMTDKLLTADELDEILRKINAGAKYSTYKYDAWCFALLEHITALNHKSMMDRGRRDAKIAVLMQVLSKLARDGQEEYAQKKLKAADKAWLDVKPADFVIAKCQRVLNDEI